LEAFEEEMLFTILLLSVLVVAAFGLLLPRLWRRSHRPASDPLDWLDQFSAASYAPMERLLDSQDYEFLASQPGYQPSIARRLRRQRIGIFQAYLGGMIGDFHRLLKAARFIVVYSPNDQTAFAGTLWRLRFRFYRSVFSVETRVLLHILGVGRVDARGLLATLERLQSYTQQLIPQFEAG
jgi:hypothetical protein